MPVRLRIVQSTENRKVAKSNTSYDTVHPKVICHSNKRRSPHSQLNLVTCSVCSNIKPDTALHGNSKLESKHLLNCHDGEGGSVRRRPVGRERLRRIGR